MTDRVTQPLHLVQHPVVAAKLAQLRDVGTGTRAFRQLVEELGTLLTYEASRDLAQRAVTVQTPLARAAGLAISPSVGLAPVLRAGTSMLQGALHLFPEAQVWHLGVYRDEHRLVPVEYYNRLPAQPTVDVCFVLDPMLATGGSAVATVEILRRWGVPDVRFVGVIGAPEGIAAFFAAHPTVPVTLAAVDARLDDRAYIVPGLGDAGDRQFGTAPL
ncbi:MAG TPA: uracil phosphoribosyltransferase [Chloroflexota bacterium]